VDHPKSSPPAGSDQSQEWTWSHPWRRPLFLGASAFVALAVVLIAHAVMLPFVLAVVIAYVLTPLVAAVESRRIPRSLAVIIVYATVLGAIGGFLRGVAPRIGLEFRNLRGELPALANEARDKWVPIITEELRLAGLAPTVATTVSNGPTTPDDTPDTGPTSAFVARPQGDGSVAIDVGTGVTISETKHGWIVEPTRDRKDEPFDPNRIIADVVGKTFAYAQNNSLEIARAVRDLVTGVGRVIFVFFITLMLAAYMMLTRERIAAFFRSLVRPGARAGFDSLLRRADEGLSGVVRGQLVICGINGALSAIGFALVGLKYWPVMALMAAVFSLVPIFGSIASAVPAVGIGLTQGLGTATFVLLWIVGIHQLEANLLNPKIMGDAAKIHPVLVIFSLLVGEHFFHVIGAVLAVPTMSIAQSLFSHFRAVVIDAGPSELAGHERVR
jgi:predicted PurR-regulated permease PerM